MGWRLSDTLSSSGMLECVSDERKLTETPDSAGVCDGRGDTLATLLAAHPGLTTGLLACYMTVAWALILALFKLCIGDLAIATFGTYCWFFFGCCCCPTLVPRPDEHDTVPYSSPARASPELGAHPRRSTVLSASIARIKSADEGDGTFRGVDSADDMVRGPVCPPSIRRRRPTGPQPQRNESGGRYAPREPDLPPIRRTQGDPGYVDDDGDPPPRVRPRRRRRRVLTAPLPPTSWAHRDPHRHPSLPPPFFRPPHPASQLQWSAPLPPMPRSDVVLASPPAYPWDRYLYASGPRSHFVPTGPVSQWRPSPAPVPFAPPWTGPGTYAPPPLPLF